VSALNCDLNHSSCSPMPSSSAVSGPTCPKARSRKPGKSCPDRAAIEENENAVFDLTLVAVQGCALGWNDVFPRCG
jgi:hypothetical protein